MLSPRILCGASLVLALGLSPLAAIVDRNNDGLSDVWAALYHPTKGATVDEDGDGQTNGREALAGTDPLNPASRFAAAPQTDTAGNLVLRWRGVWGKRYTVQSSTDLKTWTALPEPHIGRGQELSAIVRAAGSPVNEPRRYWCVVAADIDTDADGMSNSEEIELGSDPTTADAPKGTPRIYGAEFFVSPNGNDTNAGTKAAPFRTLEKAKAAVRTRIAAGIPAGGISVWLRGGVYERSVALVLGAADSGTSAATSVDWRGWPGEEARLVGGRRFSATLFAPVTSASPVWARLDPAARGRVLQLDLKAQGLTDLGVLDYHGWNRVVPPPLEVSVDSQAQQLARWPDADAHAMPPPPDLNGERITVYGTVAPAVAGTYVKFATQDGVSAFQREGLVDGQQYVLRRHSYTGTTGLPRVVWFLTTSAKPGWDLSTAPSWRCYAAEPETFKEEAASGATGRPSVLDPARINRGFAYTAGPAGLRSFTCASDRLARWTQAPDAWLDGFWVNSWAEFHVPVIGIDAGLGRLSFELRVNDNGELDMPEFYKVAGVLPQQPWYIYNLLEEITQPGEWYVDRVAGVLYLWPPAGFSPASEVVLSVANYVLHASGAQYLTFRDFTVEAARDELVRTFQVRDFAARRLLLRNAGLRGVNLAGTDSLVSRCLVIGAGRAGIFVDGGDERTLTVSNNVVEDCEVLEAGRTQISGAVGIETDGCGQTLRHNLVHRLPRGAITPRGPGHTIEFNELRDVCLASADSGAIYTPGEWISRGTKIRFNYIHDVRNELGSADVQGIYLDETSAGAEIEGNVIHDVAGFAFKINGGRDNLVRRNVVARCGGVLSASDWGLRQLKTPKELGYLQTRHQSLIAVGYQDDLPQTVNDWPTRFPECAAIPNTWDAVAADPLQWLAPRGNELVGNLCFANAKLYSYYSFMGPDPVATYFAAVTDNVQTEVSPFVDEAGGDLNLKAGSPASTIPGWKTIPFDQIGIRE